VGDSPVVGSLLQIRKIDQPAANCSVSRLDAAPTLLLQIWKCGNTAFKFLQPVFLETSALAVVLPIERSNIGWEKRKKVAGLNSDESREQAPLDTPQTASHVHAEPLSESSSALRGSSGYLRGLARTP
jgi:hypothetical protein